MASNPDAPREAPPTHRKISWRSPEILGELVLLAVIALLDGLAPLENDP